MSLDNIQTTSFDQYLLALQNHYHNKEKQFQSLDRKNLQKGTEIYRAIDRSKGRYLRNDTDGHINHFIHRIN